MVAAFYNLPPIFAASLFGCVMINLHQTSETPPETTGSPSLVPFLWADWFLQMQIHQDSLKNITLDQSRYAMSLTRRFFSKFSRQPAYGRGGPEVCHSTTFRSSSYGQLLCSQEEVQHYMSPKSNRSCIGGRDHITNVRYSMVWWYHHAIPQTPMGCMCDGGMVWGGMVVPPLYGNSSGTIPTTLQRHIISSRDKLFKCDRQRAPDMRRCAVTTDDLCSSDTPCNTTIIWYHHPWQTIHFQRVTEVNMVDWT